MKRPPLPALSDHATAAQLKDDIDCGRTGDKVPCFDPAAAPFGTDEEAAGTPTPGWAIARERRLHAERMKGRVFKLGSCAGKESGNGPSTHWYWVGAVFTALYLAALVSLVIPR